MRVRASIEIEPWQARVIESHLPEIKWCADGNSDALIDGRPAVELLQSLKSLSSVIVPFAGVPDGTRAAMAQFPHIALYNLHHNAAPTAEMAIALLLAVAKRLPQMDAMMRAEGWRPRWHDRTNALLDGRRATVFGYGSIGQRVANVCRALGMSVSAVKRSGPRDGEEDVFAPAMLDALLPETDVLIVCAPATSETEGLLDRRRLVLLPDGAILVNVGRGTIIDETALYNEVSAGRLRAGLDVWWHYPDSEDESGEVQPSKHDFASLENVVMSPHVGGASDCTEQLRFDALGRLLALISAGGAESLRIDPARGY